MNAESRMVPDAKPRSYYDRPIIKAPVWRWYIPAYFAAGGLSAGSAMIGYAASRTGRRTLARRTRVAAAAAIGVGGGLLVADLGRPERFANMLRVAKPTSPMSVGSWVAAVFGPSAGVAAACDVLGVLPGIGSAGSAVSAALAPVMATYTAVLLGDTSVPAWHSARGALPFVFASGAAVSSGGLAVALAPSDQAGPVRCLAVGAALVDLVAHRAADAEMGQALAAVGRRGHAGRLRRIAEGLLVGGAGIVALRGGRSRSAAVVGGLMLVGGAVVDRFAIVEAGSASTRDPALASIR